MTRTELLEHTFLAGGFTTRSDVARENAELIAEAAQLGLLTTQTPRDGFGAVWRMTPIGLSVLFDTFECGDPDCSYCQGDLTNDDSDESTDDCPPTTH